MGIIPRMGLDLSEGILQVAYRQGLIYFQPFSFDTGPDIPCDHPWIELVFNQIILYPALNRLQG